MATESRKAKKYIHRIAKRAIKHKRRMNRGGSVMGCPRGGSHQWRNKDKRHVDGSTFQQCKKCLQTRENNPVLKAALAVVVIIIVAWVLTKLFQ